MSLSRTPGDPGNFLRLPPPALSVVVYRNPGPAEAVILEHARCAVEANSPGEFGGSLAYVTLVESDFDRLWKGVILGDGLGTAFAILELLGPEPKRFIERHSDFMFGWVGGVDREYGNTLLLQVIPARDLLSQWN